ncbi:unnamed protein product (macronuclear) [Paramecium tetraurelia]|uniref:Uncharacterized protein n=1 Tax=Paramecium tetraurelia TaxID=5888 RepID=A0DF05_PARTE|nr:uncharacterized protein GSPATT00016448001 [Paramecium tetraurelia]CAK81622.1 unnamed protein product [Paramecium tetraurelia]|eukprot:XP_001449019.1 hypothetical protein (macronuclear) [Paramecium tetraurelia strain d4-2]
MQKLKRDYSQFVRLLQWFLQQFLQVKQKQQEKGQDHPMGIMIFIKILQVRQVAVVLYYLDHYLTKKMISLRWKVSKSLKLLILIKL